MLSQVCEDDDWGGVAESWDEQNDFLSAYRHYSTTIPRDELGIVAGSG